MGSYPNSSWYYNYDQKAGQSKDAKPDAKAAWAEIFDSKTGRFTSTAAKKQETLQSSGADQVPVAGQVPVADQVQVGPDGNTHQPSSSTISVIDGDLTAVLARASIKALADMDKDEDANSKIEDAGSRIEKWAQGVIQEAQPVVNEEFNQIVKDISKQQAQKSSYDVAAEVARLHAENEERTKDEERTKNESPPPVNPPATRTPYFLRPARESDMAQVAEIYSTEALLSYKLNDREPVGEQEFQSILSGCRTYKLPFIVAIAGPPKEDRKVDCVLGFALVAHSPRGISGSYASHGATTAKITAVVHPEFRRKHIFSSLLDAILVIFSPYYPQEGGYQWVGMFKRGDEPAYQLERFNERKMINVDMEVIVTSGASLEAVQNSEEYRQLDMFLARHAMTPVQHDEMCYRDDRFTPRWLDRVLYRHVCSGDAETEMRPKAWRVRLMESKAEDARRREEKENNSWSSRFRY